jgi:tetratricopeptide (TPR) repeat protein
MQGNTLVGRYQIIRHLGGGGFGETFVACDTQLPGSPQCVVKKLKPQSHDPVTLETARRLFDTEAQVLYKLGTHDRIPQLLAYFEENEEFYLVQEYIEGHDLSQELTPEKLFSQEQAIAFLQNVLGILAFVHEQKVIHRDVNPRNILRRNDGKLVLIDFGAVKQITTQIVNPQGTKFTVAIGTPGYIPSEQAQGNPKFSSDIYAVGIIALCALTGLPPEELVADPDTDEIVWKNQLEKNSDIPVISQELAQFLDKMVRYDFRQRYPSAIVALQALKDLYKHPQNTVPVISPILQTSHYGKKKRIITNALIGSLVIGIGTIATFLFVNAFNSRNATELSQQGNTFYELQRYQDALTAYQKAVEIRPDYPQGWNGQARTLYELKKYKESLTAYDQAIQLEPDYLEAWSGRGFALLKLQRYQEAIASFDKALQIEGDDAQVWNAKGEALVSLKQYDQGIKSYDKAIESKSDYHEAWYNKGWALQQLNRYEDAVTAYDKSVEFKPNYEKAWYNKGNAFVNLQRYQDAFAAYDKAVESKSDYTEAWLSRSNILITLRRYPEAVESFNQVIKYSPANYQAWYGKGWSLHQSQRYSEAVESYNKAATIKRNDSKLWYNRGNSLYSLQKYEEALTSYNRAVRYKPDDYQSWFSKGNTLYNLRRYQDAIASYEQAIKFKADFQQAIDARNRAQNLLNAQKLQIIVPTTKP